MPGAEAASQPSKILRLACPPSVKAIMGVLGAVHILRNREEGVRPGSNFQNTQF